MITKYNDFLNESLKDKMTGVSEDDVKKSLDKLSVFDRINKIRRYNIGDKYLPSQEEIEKGLDGLGIVDKIEKIKIYKLPHTSIPKEVSELVNDDDLKSVLSKLKKTLEMEDALDIDFEDSFSWRDEPPKKWKESSIEDRYQLLLNMVGHGVDRTTIRNKISKPMTQDQIDEIIHDDDLNSAMYSLQHMMGIKTGDNCGMFFSGYGADEGYDTAEEWWDEATPEERKETMEDYLADERSSYE